MRLQAARFQDGTFTIRSGAAFAPGAFERDGLKFFGIKLDVFAFCDFIALDDVAGLDFVAALRIDLAVSDAIAGLLVELVEADLFPLRTSDELAQLRSLDEFPRTRPMAFERHRDKNGQMSRKHGNTFIRTLRKHYGRDFGVGCTDDEKLSDVLRKLDEPLLSKLVRNLEDGKLESICRAAP